MRGSLLLKCLIISVMAVLVTVSGRSQPVDSTGLFPDTVRKGRLAGVAITQGVLYASSLTGLYFLWYKDYPQSSFHFFNDGGEWMQQDKLGHVTTAYYTSRILSASYRWTGLKHKNSVLLGSLVSFAYMLNIEILDGFSAEWGFSAGDLAANAAGCILFLGQELLWKEQRFSMKYSFHPTEYAQYRPELLGSNLIQQMVKDYNGMTFWLSGNISSFLPPRSKFPKWLNIAAGYGAEGMTGASQNQTTGTIQQTIPEFQRYRKFFLTVDVDLTRIPTRSKFLKGLFLLVSFIKIPAPALEYNTLGQFTFHPLYF